MSGGKRWLVRGSVLGIAVASVGSGACRADAPTTQPAAVPSFPGAEGFGANATGGRGGTVFEVTTLADSGPGSFRDAVSKGDRIIVFKVAGTIAFESAINVSHPNITIAGQTAPGGGICFKNFTLNIRASNVIVRYIRSRLGELDKQESDALTVWHGCRNVIIDHCSTSWSVDECLSLAGDVQFVTVQWCSIGGALRQSIHAKGPHGYGSLSRADGPITWHHNLWAHNDARNPRLGDNYGKDPRPLFDVRNNVIYDYGDTCSGLTQGTFNANYVNNYIKAGPSSKAKTPITVGNKPLESNLHYYITGNVWEGHDDFTNDNSKFPSTTEFGGQQEFFIVDKPFDVAPVSMTPAKQAYDDVLNNVGATLPKRDSIDERLMNEVRTGTGKMINSESEVGGWPDLTAGAPVMADSDHDGMPDSWETDHGLNPNDAGDAMKDPDKDGYVNIEEYLNNTDPQKFVDYKDPKNNVSSLGVPTKVSAAPAPATMPSSYRTSGEYHRDLVFSTVGDQKLMLDACAPADAKTHPIVILIHGGGWGGGNRYDLWTLFEPLTQGGFTFFTIEYRLAPANHWPACFDDTKAAICWVKEHASEYRGDPSRIALLGYSAGGHLACLAAVQADDSTRVQAVVGLAPPTDHVADSARRRGLSKSMQNLLDRPQRMDDEAKAILNEISPINYVKPGLPPFLLMQGNADQSVPYEQTVAFKAKLDAAGVPCELITIPDAPHAIREWKSKDPQHPQEIVAWLKKTLGE